MPTAILFVCLGNICRSPLAEGAMRAEAARRGLDVELDSAGIGAWHAGEPPDRRAQAAAARNGIDISNQRARRIAAGDFDRFDHVVALDREVLRALQAMRPEGAPARLSLLLDHLPGRQGEDVADPYYGGEAHFDVTWRDVAEAARALADKIAGRR